MSEKKNPEVHVAFIHDFTNPKTGNTFKEDNLKIKHSFNVGDLVEIIAELDYPSEYDHMRAYVIGQVRDCDGTPLYRLGTKGMELHPESDSFYNSKSMGSFSEKSLKKIDVSRLYKQKADS